MSREHLLTCEHFAPGQDSTTEIVRVSPAREAAHFRLDDGTLWVFSRQELLDALSDNGGDLKLRRVA